MRSIRFTASVFCVLSLSGCSALLPTPPEAAVGDDQVALAVHAFVDASAMLARAYSYRNAYADDSPVSSAASRITGIGSKRRVTLAGLSCDYKNNSLCPQYLPNPSGFVEFKDSAAVIRNYVKNGSQLSQILCRNYLAGLSDKNSAFTALRKQLNITGGLAELTMVAARASARSIGYFGAAETFLNASLENFGEYEYLTPDQSTLQDLVFKSQNALDTFYTSKQPPTTVAEAVNAVHRIDSLCTKAGLRHLINRSIANINIVSDADGTLKVTGSDDLKLYNRDYSAAKYLSVTNDLNRLGDELSVLKAKRKANPSDAAILTKIEEKRQEIADKKKELVELTIALRSQ